MTTVRLCSDRYLSLASCSHDVCAVLEFRGVPFKERFLWTWLISAWRDVPDALPLLNCSHLPNAVDVGPSDQRPSDVRSGQTEAPSRDLIQLAFAVSVEATTTRRSVRV